MNPTDVKGAPVSSSSLRMALGASLAALTISGAMAQTLLVPPAEDFVAAAAQSHHFEIMEGHIALAESHDPRVRAFAQEMIMAHTRTSETLQQAVTKAGLGELPYGMNGDQQKMLSALQSQRSPDFDRTYLKQQVVAHDQALVAERAYAAQGDNSDIRQAAALAVPVIEHHLEMTKKLQSEIGSS